MTTRELTTVDRALMRADRLLRVINARAPKAQRPSPAEGHREPALSAEEKRHAAGLMRVNHTGEVCAQALYEGQALVARAEGTRENLLAAAQEEVDHLVWCEQRLDELDAKPSRLNPLFYGVSFALGAATAVLGDRVSLGFVHATEEGVARHLREHLQALPAEDRKSQLILQQMLVDEERHGAEALAHGGQAFPRPLKEAMSAASQLMTRTSYWV